MSETNEAPVLLDCGDPAALNVPIVGGVGLCYVHGYRLIQSLGPSTPPETIEKPPPPAHAKEQMVVTCPHCGQEFML